jgi:hypothetical protein
MIRISHKKSVIIQEYGGRFIEGDTMFALIRPGFARIPGKPEITHAYNITTL